MNAMTADDLWQRATSPEAPDDGSRAAMALRAMNELHAIAVTRGVLPGLSALGDRAASAVEGFTLIGLPAVATLLRRAHAEAASVHPDEVEGLASEADLEYRIAVPTDAMLEAAFRRRFALDSTAFAD